MTIMGQMADIIALKLQQQDVCIHKMPDGSDAFSLQTDYGGWRGWSIEAAYRVCRICGREEFLSCVSVLRGARKF
jgi:hypothetical protein